MSSKVDLRLVRKLTSGNNAFFLERDIQHAVSCYPDLSLQLEGTGRLCLMLHGTIPVQFCGQTYNIPVTLKINEHFPYQVPEVYVTPTFWMYIRCNQYVDTYGNVNTSSFYNWRVSPGSLKLLLDALVTNFGQNPPLGSLTKMNWLNGRAEYIARLKLPLNFVDSVRTKQDAIEVVEAHAEITVSLQTQPLVSGVTQDVLTLSGTLSGNQTVQYRIHLTSRYPQEPPVVFVLSSNVRVNAGSKYIDRTGLVKTPFLKSWTTFCNLLSLTQDLKNIITINRVSSTSGVTSSVQATGGTYTDTDCVPGRKAMNNSSILSSEQVSGRRSLESTGEHSLGSAECFDFHCNPCNNNKSGFVEADGYCRTCKQYLCKACIRLICKSSRTGLHSIKP